MANVKRSYSTDWAIAPADISAPKERIELLRKYYLNAYAPKAEAVSDALAPASQIVDFGEQACAKFIAFPTYKELTYAPSEYMWAMKEWDGHVTAIEADQFISLITSVGDTNGEEECLEYPLVSLSEKDRKNLSVGSIFRLSAGYSKKETGQIRQQLSLYFRPKRKYMTEKQGLKKPYTKLFQSTIQAPASKLFVRD